MFLHRQNKMALTTLILHILFLLFYLAILKNSINFALKIKKKVHVQLNYLTLWSCSMLIEHYESSLIL